jgi:16S rRNA (guanine527-N7)-methyltransferase
MDPSRIAELLTPFLKGSDNEVCHSDEPLSGKEESALLSQFQLRNISTYIDILQRWNARVNLTAIRNEEEIVTRHFGESLFAARHLFPSVHVGTAEPSSAADPALGANAGEISDPRGSRGRAALQGRVETQRQAGASAPAVADIGSGAGFPGIPIKLWAPHISLTLIESNQKKATFLREVTRVLTLTNVNIQNQRAESLIGTHFDVVTLRAVERFEKILPTAASLVAPEGRLALLISHAQFPSAQSALPALAWGSPVLIPGSQSRAIVIADSRNSMSHERHEPD